MASVATRARTIASDVIHNAVPLGKTTFAEFQRHKAPRLAAALSYFTIFSIAPLLIVVIGIAGFFLHSHTAVRNEIFGNLAHSAGPSEAAAIRGIVDSTFNRPRGTIIAELVSWGVFFLGALGLFGALQDALNTVWDVKAAKHGGIWLTIRNRATSFGMVLAIAFLLLVSLVINSALTGLSGALTHIFPGFDLVMKIVDFIVSLAVITGLFALIYRFLPDTTIKWEDVWVGAIITALLFDIGQFLLGWYMGRASLASGYGTFGSLVAFMIWVNYSAQILLFGAEFTHVFAQTHGSRASGTGGTTHGPVPVAATTTKAEGRIVEATTTDGQVKPAARP